MLRHLLAHALLALGVRASLKDLAYCDPLRKDMQCPPDAAFAGSVSFDFAQASWEKGLYGFWSVDNDTVNDAQRLAFGLEGMTVAVAEEGDAPTLASHGYLLFGTVSVKMRAAPGRGFITALVLKSDSGDEIDWELLGAYENQASSNYFHDGKALFNTYNTTHPLPTSSTAAFHTYAITWTASELTFSIDGTPRKTWRIGDIPAAQWPQTPMQVKLGVWSVVAASDHGEVQWAGGLPDWTRA